MCSLNVRGLRDKNKRVSLVQWCKDLKIDILCIQETFCTKDYKTKFNKDWLPFYKNIKHCYTDSCHSRGVAIIFGDHLDLTVHSTFRSNDGRKLLINCSVGNLKLSLVNIYAPCKVKDRIEFFTETGKWVTENITEDTSLFVCGDFNSVRHKSDRTSGNIEGCSKYFENILKKHKLIDIYRTNSSDKGYTWVNPGNPQQKSRIDYILSTKYINQFVQKCIVVNAPTPDHKAVFCKLEIIVKQRGKGYWKLNTAILEEKEYKDMIIEIIENTILEYLDKIPKRVLWDFCKVRIKEGSIKYCIRRAQLQQNEFIQLNEQIEEIDKQIEHRSNNTDLLKTERQVVKNRLNQIMLEKAKGSFIRSRAKWLEEGERCTTFFARLEKIHQTNNTINKLTTHNGEVENDNEIIKEIVSFYKQLYTSTNPNIDDIKDYLMNTHMVNILSNDEKKTCEGTVTKQECSEVLKHMKNNKAPGLDGIPIEFYKTFWDQIGNLMVDVYNEAHAEGELSYSQKTAVFAVIFKKGDRLLLKNYRPISLATADYKLLAFVLARRLQKVLNKIISSSQAGYIKKRFIGHNIRLIEDLIDYADHLNKEASIIFLDFKRAFDSIEWNFIFETLKRFNFGNDFIKWIYTLYNNAGAKVKNNGYLSETFMLQRGVRQGCPVSALLFIIVVEVLSLNIKQDSTIEGIKIHTKHGTKETKIGQFADDAFLALDNLKSIPNAIQNINKFCDVSGMSLNLEKCEGIKMNQNICIPTEYKTIKWVKVTKCLGIYVGFDKDECFQRNWCDKLEKIEKILERWRYRDLTIFGKIVVIKMLIIPQVTFAATNLTIPNNIVQQLTTTLFRFLWGTQDKIKREVLIGNYESGGIKMIDVQAFFDSIKATWIKRYLECHTHEWAILMKMHLEIVPKHIIFHMNFDQSTQFPLINKLPIFYQEVIIAFNRSKLINPPSCFEEMLNHVIWGNKYLMVKYQRNKLITLYFQTWIEKNIIYVKDLLILNGQIDQKYIYDKISPNANFLSEISKIIHAFKPYQHIMGTNIPSNIIYYLPINPTLNINGDIYDLKTKSSKFFYNRLISLKMKYLSLERLQKDISITDIPTISAIMIKKVQEIKENKLKEFNYKVIARIGACGNLVNKWDSNVSPLCSACSQKETQIHIIYLCPNVKHIWITVSHNIGKNITVHDILFGTNVKRPINNLISQICFSLHKYWVIKTQEKFQSNPKELLDTVINDLKYKSCIMHEIKEPVIGEIYSNASKWLTTIK